MKKMNFLIVGLFVMLFFVITTNHALLFAAEAQKETVEGKCYVVAIRGKAIYGQQTPATTQSQIEVEPMNINIPKGSCVVWVNWANRPEIRLSFAEGKACQSKTEAAMGFRFTPTTGCYITDYLKMGQTSSLRFMQAGTFKYDLFVEGRIAPVASGEVVVGSREKE